MIKRILVPLDRSELSEHAMETATRLAALHSAKIRLVYAWPVATAMYAEPIGGMVMVPVEDRADAQEYLDRIAGSVRWGHGLAVESALITPPAAPAICEEARSSKSDLIVMATHGRTGWSRFWLGSVADEVVRRADVPVWLVRPDEDEIETVPAIPMQMLVPLDGSTEAEEVLAALKEWLNTLTVRIKLFRVVTPVRSAVIATGNGTPIVEIDAEATERAVRDASGYLDGVMATLARSFPNATIVREVTIDQSPARAILQAAVGEDLVALATHARGASRLIIGSVADKVLRGTGASLFLVRRHAVHAPFEEHEGAHAIMASGGT